MTSHDVMMWLAEKAAGRAISFICNECEGHAYCYCTPVLDDCMSFYTLDLNADSMRWIDFKVDASHADDTRYLETMFLRHLLDLSKSGLDVYAAVGNVLAEDVLVLKRGSCLYSLLVEMDISHEMS